MTLSKPENNTKNINHPISHLYILLQPSFHTKNVLYSPTHSQTNLLSFKPNQSYLLLTFRQTNTNTAQFTPDQHTPDWLFSFHRSPNYSQLKFNHLILSLQYTLFLVVPITQNPLNFNTHYNTTPIKTIPVNKTNDIDTKHTHTQVSSVTQVVLSASPSQITASALYCIMYVFF